MPPYVVVIDMRPNNSRQPALFLSEENGDPSIFISEKEADEALEGHILGPFPRIVVDLDDACFVGARR
jgi:hypothetical protein